MITDKLLNELGFQKYGKEKHLKLHHGKDRVLIIRKNRLFFVDGHDFWVYGDMKSDSEYIRGMRLQRLWKSTSILCDNMSIINFRELIESVKQGQWI